RCDPVHGRPEPRKPPMNDDEVAISHEQAGLVFQRWRQALDEVEEALAAGSDVCAVLDVCGRPVALRRDIVSLVEKGIEGFEHHCLVIILYQCTHQVPPCGRTYDDPSGCSDSSHPGTIRFDDASRMRAIVHPFTCLGSASIAFENRFL